MKSKKILLVGSFFLALWFGLVGTSVSALKCPTGSERAGEEVKSFSECSVPKAEGGDVLTTVNTIINVVVSLMGIAAVIVIILGGITFTTSQGDTGKVTKAKNTILYGVVGLIIALLAFAIVNFVLGSITS